MREFIKGMIVGYCLIIYGYVTEHSNQNDKIMQQLKQQHAMIVGIKQQTDKTADPKLWTMEVIEKGCKNE